MTKILLVEDDPSLGMLIRDLLEGENYAVDWASDGKAALKFFANGGIDLCLVDIMLPQMDGFTLVEHIRASDQVVPVIFLTARSMEDDKVKGFRIGADDYITKPFSKEELKLRIRAVLRRNTSSLNKNSSEWIIGQSKFYPDDLKLLSGGKTVQLTRKEAALLQMLASAVNQLVRKEDLLVNIWGENDYFMGRSMDVYIAKLRKMLRDDNSLSIVNVHNTGYRLEEKAHNL